MTSTHKNVYIIAINGGHVVEVDNSGKELKTQKATSSKSQQWVMERNPHKSDEFALRNVATNGYLGAPKGVSGTHCIADAKQQFWRAERGHAPGSFW
jgi:hypothetical protein